MTYDDHCPNTILDNFVVGTEWPAINWCWISFNSVYDFWCLFCACKHIVISNEVQWNWNHFILHTSTPDEHVCLRSRNSKMQNHALPSSSWFDETSHPYFKYIEQAANKATACVLFEEETNEFIVSVNTLAITKTIRCRPYLHFAYYYC